MALSEEDRLWIEEKRKKIEREERELKRRGIIPYTDEEKEEIEIEEAKMRKQAGFTAEALRGAGFSAQDTTRNPATGLPIKQNSRYDVMGNPYGFSN